MSQYSDIVLLSEYRGSYQAPLITLNTLTNKKRPPQKLLFSATLSQDPEKLQQLGLFHPKLFTSVVKTKGGANSGMLINKCSFFYI